MQSIHSLIPDPEALLALEPEELAGFVLEIFNSSVHKERGLVSAGNFISQEWLRDYPYEHQNDIRYALVEALVWLENEGLIAQDPGQGKVGFSLRDRDVESKDRLTWKPILKQIYYLKNSFIL